MTLNFRFLFVLPKNIRFFLGRPQMLYGGWNPAGIYLFFLKKIEDEFPKPRISLAESFWELKFQQGGGYLGVPLGNLKNKFAARQHLIT